jgi:hypothetical protein
MFEHSLKDELQLGPCLFADFHAARQRLRTQLTNYAVFLNQAPLTLDLYYGIDRSLEAPLRNALDLGLDTNLFESIYDAFDVPG